MPKHALTFKHLLGSVSTQRAQSDSRSVNDLLERSRASASAWTELPPHLVWAPSAGSGPESVGVHPAELLRRERAAHASAARRVAGPAPPRSWRPREAPSKSTKETVMRPEREANEVELVAAETFLGHRPQPGRSRGGGVGLPSLVDMCLQLTLRLLRDESVVWDPEVDGDGDEEDRTVTMREAVLAGACELDLHLRAGLLSSSALLPSNSPLRLADGDIRALLEYEVPHAPQPPPFQSSPAAESAEEDDEWDTDTLPRPTLHHLPLMLHPAPLRLLRDVPRLSALALTSLDLAFASLPPLERLVTVLPPGLRALGLAGVRAAPKSKAGGESYDAWERGLGALARKMIVLQTLDVSYFPLGAGASIAALLPERSDGLKHLPSLLVLGLRSVRDTGGDVSVRRKALRAEVVERAGRWIDVRFE